MSFGLKISPGTFQRTMDVTLAALKWQFTIVYLDDIVLYTRPVKENAGSVRGVLKLLNVASVTLRLEKCRFFTETIAYFVQVLHLTCLELSS